MQLLWCRLEGRSGHEAAYALLAELYRVHTGKPLPPVEKTARGKPFLVGSSLHFSISHTKNHAFCCLSEENVGIDGEEIGRTFSPNLPDRILSPAEKKRMLEADDPAQAFLRLWVLKESCSKLLGKGLGNYLRDTDFSPEDPRIQEIDGCFVAVMTDKGE